MPEAQTLLKNKWKEDKYGFIDIIYEVIAIVDKKKSSVSSFAYV